MQPTRCSVYLLCCFFFASVVSGSEEAPLEKVRIVSPEQTSLELQAFLHALVQDYVLPESSEESLASTERIRHRLLEEVVFRGIPESWRNYPLQVDWQDLMEGDGYTIRKFRYEILPNFWIGGLLYEPNEWPANKVPAVLNVNGHARPEGMTLTYKQERCINQVKRGAIALNLEWIGMGQLNQPGYDHFDSAYLNLCGRSGLSVFVLSLQRGLDLLLAHPRTDPTRVAVTGLSGGGWQTITISALDPRVTLSAPNAGYIGIRKRIDFLEDVGDIEQCPVDFHTIADYVQLTAMLAPRPALLIYNAQDDCCFQAARAYESVYEPIVPLYALFGHPERFDFHVNNEPGTHNYLWDNQLAFIRFLNQHFLAGQTTTEENLAKPTEIRPQETLAVRYPEDNANFYTLAAEAMESLPRKGISHLRDRLYECVRPEPVYSIRLEPVDPPSFPEVVSAKSVQANRVRWGKTWSGPLVVLEPQGDVRGNTLIIADLHQAETLKSIHGALQNSQRVIVANILFMGECVPKRGAFQQAMTIDTLGRRALGVQVAQVQSLRAFLKAKYPNESWRLIASGRHAGMAALTALALEPGGVESAMLQGMESSLKDLLAKKIPYRDAAPMFCFGILELADIPDLVKLAEPTQISIAEPKS